MTNICFIILNYLAFNNTIECIESIKKQSSVEYDIRIIVVDNASPNDSYMILKNKYDNDSMVYIYQTNHNIGFACGNNYGYRKLKESNSSV